MNRRVELRDVEDMLQRQTWYLQPGRYRDLFLAGHFDPEPGDADGSDTEDVVDEVDELDRYFENLESRRTMNGGDLLVGSLDGPEEGWL